MDMPYGMISGMYETFSAMKIDGMLGVLIQHRSYVLN